ncbi:MAG: undecaprenyl-diphosphate phosphatase [Acidobacteria bacterium]|nr:undecaprenyl-diphosphate phosphatase [Acidobacteriota bacterium]
MPVFQAIVLAIVQGITEWLPISSTAHLFLTRWLLGWPEPGLTFDVALHVGTLLSALVYFAPTWLRLVRVAFGGKVRISDETAEHALSPEEARQERLLLWFLMAATVPGALAGVLLKKQVESTFRSAELMAWMMILVAFVMWWADRVATQRKSLTHVTLGDAMIIGAAQAVALVPGVSRSGSTISAGLFRGLSRDAAARFSFLLSTPIIAGASLLKAREVWREGLAPEMHMPFLVGTVVSGIAGYAAIAGLVRYLRTRDLKIFVVYRVVFGIIILALVYFAHLR